MRTIESRIEKIEERLHLKDEDKIVVIINEYGWYPDGTIPDCRDRPLDDWECMKHQHNPGEYPPVFILGPLREYRLRYPDRSGMAEKRISWTEYAKWLSVQIKEKPTEKIA